ncbi:GGDEF domain-containing protein [Deferribacter autotrophicus]|uniref:diguanylate cyclase n=1 Tax=Deferribacter autotrophicus TaxID=500465 RepID=A0A5A8F5G1_9BACT|nr:GGDEF domain-containing protein [Deferribacter autotrophicus]KAA0257944.1 GGDEF domain-containing protein [Deferribacter autotrophicus]
MINYVRRNILFLLFTVFILIFEVSNNVNNKQIIITTLYLLFCIVAIQYIDEDDEYIFHIIFVILLGFLSYFSKSTFLYLQCLAVVFLFFQSKFYYLKLLFVFGLYGFDLLFLNVPLLSDFSFIYISLIVSALTARFLILSLLDKINELSITDDLTGLLNQKGFFKKFEDEYYRSVRYNKNFTLMMLDSDDLKRINDTYGHKYGTYVILFIAEEIKKNIRRTDFACRYGGDEFMICLVETPIENGMKLAERLKETIAMKPIFTDKGKSFNITVSIGAVGYPESSEKIYELLDMVDKAMYQAKNKGKNQVCLLTKNSSSKEMDGN